MTCGGSLVRNARMIASIVCGQTVWRHAVRDVAVPLGPGLARPWWKVCLRGAVPLGSAKQAGVNAACRW